MSGEFGWSTSARPSYRNDYGLRSVRRDRFDGEPRWLETVIREYELGDRGPLHECDCHCSACSRLAWARMPVCKCPLGKQWGISLSLDDAMRRKWSKCRCSPGTVGVPEFPPGQWCCPCLLLLPTQECKIPRDGGEDREAGGGEEEEVADEFHDDGLGEEPVSLEAEYGDAAVED